MIRPIMKDVLFLAQKSEPATKADKPVIQDLLDTLKANEANCVGMAANMIGVKKLSLIHIYRGTNRIFCASGRLCQFDRGAFFHVFWNPVIDRHNRGQAVIGCGRL